MAALSKAEIQEKLKNMRGWAHQGKAIQKRYSLKSFVPAIALVNVLPAVTITATNMELK